MRKSRILAAAFLAMIFLGGCESVELEQRSFPLAVGIDLQGASAKAGGEETEGMETKEKAGGKEAEGMETKVKDVETETEPKLVVSFDFPDLAQISEKGKTVDTPMAMSLEGDDLFHVEKSYENNTNRILDYNHLKAVVVGENLISEPKRLRNLLLAWEQQERAARNISLFVGSSSAAEILTLTEETEGSMGTYLEEMLESQKDFSQKKIATVGSLINQWHNQNELLLIPVLTEQGKRPAVSGYAAIENFEYRGMLTVEEAMQAFLSQGLLETFTCEPDKEEVAEISDIRVTTSVEQEKGQPVVTVSITGQGRLKIGQANSVGQQYQIEQRMEQHILAGLQKCAAKLREEYGIDMTNSYIYLGGLNRGLYQVYKNLPDEYSQNVRQVFEVDIEILNW